MSINDTVTVRILEKEYQVACPKEQQAELIVSASYLDKQMRNIRQSGKVVGLERIAIMAALNISHELLQASEASQDQSGLEERYKHLSLKIDNALHQLRQLEIS